LASPKKSLAVSDTVQGLSVKVPPTAPDPIATVVVLEMK
jgi:hypothetical protein